MSKNLKKYSERAVFAIASEESILTGKIQDNRPWTSIKKYFDALNPDIKMVLLLENASEFKGVEWAAVIKDIQIKNGITNIKFERSVNLSKPYPKGSLIKTVDGMKLDSNYRRSYVPCKLPLIILKELDNKKQRSIRGAISVEQYETAFSELGPKFSIQQMDMLVGHANTIKQTISMQKLAELAGYTGYKSANLHYGKLGSALAHFLNLNLPDPHNKIQSICDGAPNYDEAGHFQWVLKQPVVEALKRLGLLKSRHMKNLPEPKEPPEVKGESPTTRAALIESRVGQGPYRARMLCWWGGKCAVTGCDDVDLLIASHALPWSKSTNIQRLDNFNGLPLTPNLDKLFDRGSISFADNGSILISKSIQPKTLKSLGVTSSMKLRKVDSRVMEYLKLHRKIHGY